RGQRRKHECSDSSPSCEPPARPGERILPGGHYLRRRCCRLKPSLSFPPRELSLFFWFALRNLLLRQVKLPRPPRNGRRDRYHGGRVRQDERFASKSRRASQAGGPRAPRGHGASRKGRPSERT